MWFQSAAAHTASVDSVRTMAGARAIEKRVPVHLERSLIGVAFASQVFVDLAQVLLPESISHARSQVEM